MSGCCFLQCLRDYINRRRVKISVGLFSVLGTQLAGLRLCEFYLFRVCSEMRDDFRLNGWHHNTKNNCTKKSNQLMLLTFDSIFKTTSEIQYNTRFDFRALS